MDIKKALDFLTAQGLKDIISNLQDRINGLLNDNSELYAANKELKKKIEELENQKRLFLGEKPRPDFSKDKPKDRTAPKTKEKKDPSLRRKKADLEVDKTVVLRVPLEHLDPTYEYKGKRKIVIQEISFNRENICFEIERFYSSEHRKVLEGKIPPEYQGYEFGPKLRSFVLHLFYHGDCTHNKIRLILKGIGISICNQTINNILLEDYGDLEKEFEDKRLQAIEKYQYQHIDDTGAKVLKVEGTSFTYVCSNPEFTSFFTTNSKGRSAAIDALTRASKRVYKLNGRAISVLLSSEFVKNKLRLILESHIGDKVYEENEIGHFIDSLNVSYYIASKIKTAMHIGALSDGHLGLAGEALVSDDAPNFKGLLTQHSLCWVHELRHYKLLPVMYEEHAEILEGFLKSSWDLVSMLKKHQEHPMKSLRERILKRVDTLFIEPSIWPLLDKLKARTAAKLEKLLYPLSNSLIPTDNNLAERDLRGRVIKRKISLFNQTRRGSRAWDLWFSLKETTRKLGLNFWNFIEDRIFLRFAIPSLSALSIS